MFLWHFPSGRPAWPLASTVPCGVRTFLERLVDARDRPAGWARFNYSTETLSCQEIKRAINWSLQAHYGAQESRPWSQSGCSTATSSTLLNVFPSRLMT